MASERFDFVRALPEHYEEVIQFLVEHFLVEETMNVALRLTKEDFMPLVKELVPGCLSSGYSVLARARESGQIAGIILNTVWRRENCHVMPKRPAKPSAGQVIELFLCTFSTVFWNLIPSNVDAVLHREILSVGAQWQRLGLGGRLVDEGFALDELKEKGIGAFVSKTSSLANQRLMEKKGYKELVSIPFASILDEPGNPLVVPQDGTTKNVLLFKIIQ